MKTLRGARRCRNASKSTESRCPARSTQSRVTTHESEARIHWFCATSKTTNPSYLVKKPSGFIGLTIEGPTLSSSSSSIERLHSASCFRDKLKGTHWLLELKNCPITWRVSGSSYRSSSWRPLAYVASTQNSGGSFSPKDQSDFVEEQVLMDLVKEIHLFLEERPIRSQEEHSLKEASNNTRFPILQVREDPHIERSARDRVPP